MLYYENKLRKLLIFKTVNFTLICARNLKIRKILGISRDITRV